ncbi:MAG: DUF2071 domain-containing protein [Bacteroidia bacterium]
MEKADSEIKVLSEFNIKRIAVIAYRVEPELLYPFLPENTELHYWNNNCLLCLQGYILSDIEIQGYQLPYHKSLQVMNLHFYVKHQNGEDCEYGIVYIKNFLSKSLFKILSNHLYNSNSITKITACVEQIEDELISASYSWAYRLKNFSFHVMGNEIPVPYRPDSFEEFISTHQWIFAKTINNKTLQYKMAHSKWQFHQTINVRVKLDFGTEFGEEFYYLNEENPIAVALAEGSWAGLTSTKEF